MIRKFVTRLAVLFVSMIAALSLIISLQPSAYSVERSATMAAAPAEVFAQVNDLQAWDAWSPWKKLDPQAKATISNPSAGQGATFTWAGNAEVGEGKLTIVASKLDELVDIEQAFVKPMEGKARMVFTFAPEGDGTKLTWKLHGTNDFMGKAVCLFADMDAFLGGAFEEGLANIKAVVEKTADPQTEAAPKL
jgi:hypothetical protein